MKKTILAMAVPALIAAGAANASVSLYDQDGVSVDASGAMEVQYKQGHEKDSEAKLSLDDGDLAIKTGVEVSDDLKAIGSMEFKFEKNAVENDRLYVGLEGGFGTITAGRQTTIADDVGIGKDLEFGGGIGVSGFEDVDGDEIFGVVSDADTVVKYTIDMDAFYAGLSYLGKQDTDKDTKDAEQIAAKLGARFEGLDARIYVINGKLSDGTDTADDKFMGVEAEYSIDGIGLAAGYGKRELGNDSDKYKASHIQLAADYTLNDTTFALGYTKYEGKVGSDKILENAVIYGNVSHQLHGNVKVYAEVETSDLKILGDDQDDQVGFATGLEVKF
jgi:predicted porin